MEFATLTTDARGNARLSYETKKADAFPFGATLADLGGRAPEARNGANATVLAGSLPTPQ